MIQVEHITRAYGNQKVLSDVSLQVNKGDFMVLFGDDDAGKTALLQIMMGFDTEYDGKVSVLKKDPMNWTKREFQKVRYVPDDIIWAKDMTVAEYFFLSQISALKYNQKLQERLCEKYQISVENSLLEMTYQENKMVQIIAAVCAIPQLLILDEPLNFLSRKAYLTLLEDLRTWNKLGMTILIAAEHYEDVRGYAKQYAYIREGELIKQDIVPSEDYRYKVITIEGGKTPMIKDLITGFMSERNGRLRFSYQGSADGLVRMFGSIECEDIVVDELTLQEEIEMDFSRWE